MHLLTWDVVDAVEGRLKIRLQRDAVAKRYAILSHRWGNPEDEVSYNDMVSGDPEKKRGYQKLKGCCQQAWRDRLKYAWVDTCCIDKSSSAELSEAINSMYTYYERSSLCYVFLDDVSVDSTTNYELRSSELSHSAWFTRGWTLQELIAPTRVQFFNKSWVSIGRKGDIWLSQTISNITNIDISILNYPSEVKRASVAKRMSWAAWRETTRIEDRAYSLMGIFSVYMPPLYGEGENAFIRLQEAILRTSNDHSIFAWTLGPKNAPVGGLENVSTMLAVSPDQFEFSSNFRPLSRNAKATYIRNHGNKLDYSITNVGLSIQLPVVPLGEVEGLFAAFLACTEREDQCPSAILLHTSPRITDGYYWRTKSNEGPIERASRLWFSADGREDIAARDLYILPRFTTISSEITEPAWKKESLVRVPTSRVWWNQNILNDLHHIPEQLPQPLRQLRRIQNHQVISFFKMVHNKPCLFGLLPKRNAKFCCRRGAILQLRDWLSLSDIPTELQILDQGKKQICIITGPPGIGKKELALEFCHHLYQTNLIDNILWIPAKTDEAILTAFRKIAAILNIASGEALEENIIQKVLNWPSNKSEPHQEAEQGRGTLPKRLLVFVNADEPSLLTRYLPPDGSTFVLITSRSRVFGYNSNVKCITLEPFSVDEVSELLGRLTAYNPNLTVAADMLGGLPLAIDDMATFILKRGLLLAEYLTLSNLEGHTERERRLYSHGLEYYKSRVFMLLSASSRALLQVISFLEADFILMAILAAPPPDISQLYALHGSNLSHDLEELINQSLIERASRDGWPGIRTHHFIQNYVIKAMSEGEFRVGLETAVGLVRSAWHAAASGERSNESDAALRKGIFQQVSSLKKFGARSRDMALADTIQQDLSKLAPGL